MTLTVKLFATVTVPFFKVISGKTCFWSVFWGEKYYIFSSFLSAGFMNSSASPATSRAIFKIGSISLFSLSSTSSFRSNFWILTGSGSLMMLRPKLFLRSIWLSYGGIYVYCFAIEGRCWSLSFILLLSSYQKLWEFVIRGILIGQVEDWIWRPNIVPISSSEDSSLFCISFPVLSDPSCY